MLNDFFDDGKNQCCVQFLESSWFVWNFEVDQPYFGKDADYLAPKYPVFANVYKVKVKQQANQSFSNVTAYIMRDMEYHAPPL
jgi:hypothetical protein